MFSLSVQSFSLKLESIMRVDDSSRTRDHYTSHLNQANDTVTLITRLHEAAHSHGTWLWFFKKFNKFVLPYVNK